MTFDVSTIATVERLHGNMHHTIRLEETTLARKPLSKRADNLINLQIDPYGELRWLIFSISYIWDQNEHWHVVDHTQ